MSGIITRITKNKWDRNRKNIYIDGTFAFSVNLFESLSLKKNDTLEDDQISEYQKDSHVYQAYEDAIRLLKTRHRSTGEMKIRLKQKKYPDPIIQKTIHRLLEESYLNDLEFARMWTDSRMRFSPRSRYALSFELKQKGISEEIIDKVLQKADDTVLAWETVRKKISHWKHLEGDSFRHKVFSLLKNRGFTYDISADIFEKACVKKEEFLNME